MNNADDGLFCDSCGFVYHLIRNAGDRCNDLSWRDHDYPMLAGWPIQSRGYRQWLCHGRVWPAGSAQLRHRVSKRKAERARPGQQFGSPWLGGAEQVLQTRESHRRGERWRKTMAALKLAGF